MRRRQLRLSLPLLVLAVLFAVPGHGQERSQSTIEWLATEPVTLMDLGLIRLKSDLGEFANDVFARGEAVKRPDSGAYYEWRQRRIIAYVTVKEELSLPSRPLCRQLFDRLARFLLAKAPGGTRQATWYLENLFLHDGTGNYFRPKSMAEDLVQIVRFEITLIGSGLVTEAKNVRCAGRLDAGPDDLSYTTS